MVKIVTWNCHGNFSDKFRKIKELDADVYVIQECERTTDSADPKYREFARNGHWVGHLEKSGKGKGLGIFVKEGHKLTDNRWSMGKPGYFISCRFDDSFNILGAWAYADEDRCYAPGVLNYLTEHKSQLNTDWVIAGDLNIDLNVKGQWASTISQTRDIFALLKSLGLESAYCHQYKEGLSAERRKTFYRAGKPSSHIDYIFADKSKIKRAELLDPDVWITRDVDHVPLVAEIDFDAQKK